MVENFCLVRLLEPHKWNYRQASWKTESCPNMFKKSKALAPSANSLVKSKRNEGWRVDGSSKTAKDEKVMNCFLVIALSGMQSQRANQRDRLKEDYLRCFKYRCAHNDCLETTRTNTVLSSKPIKANVQSKHRNDYLWPSYNVLGKAMDGLCKVQISIRYKSTYEASGERKQQFIRMNPLPFKNSLL